MSIARRSLGLSSLIDAITSKNPLFMHWMAVDYIKDQEVFFEQNYKNAVCFMLDIPETLDGVNPIEELVILPYETIYFEFPCETHLGKLITVSIIAKQTKEHIYGSVWVKSFTGWRNVFCFKLNKNGGAELAGNNPEEVGARDSAIQIIALFKRFLNALNCTNVRRVERKPDAKMQKARAKRGKKPLFSYWTLELDLSRPESSESLGGTHASPRLHLRRGHPRQYAPGKYTWVQPCVVGNKALGMVHKDYALAA